MKKFILTAILTLILFSILSFSCFAWVPSYQFTCYIDYLQIPDGAVYVDLLLPISQNDDNYTEFNEANGEKFSISQQSEIVEYNKDGYMSYTFHLNNATAEIKPSYFIDAVCEKDFYNSNKEIFEKFLSIQPHIINEDANFSAQIFLGSEEEIAATKIYNMLELSIDNEKKFTHTCFCSNNSDVEEFYNFCQKYKTAKMAYISQNGDIISVSNEIPITKKDFFKREPLINIELKGNFLTSQFTYGPPVFIIYYFLVFLLIAAPVTIIFIIAVYFIKRRK